MWWKYLLRELAFKLSLIFTSVGDLYIKLQNRAIYLSLKACSSDKTSFRPTVCSVMCHNDQQRCCIKAKPGGEETGCTGSIAIPSDKKLLKLSQKKLVPQFTI